MKIFITGATGFIGNKLALRLANEGNEIHAILRSLIKKPLLEHQNIRVFKGKLSDKNSLRAAIEGCEQIYHLAAFADVWSKDPYKFYDVNVVGTENILDLAIEMGIEKTVITSTAGVIGPSDHGIVNESSIRRVDYFNEYESSKAYSESMIKDRVLAGQNIVIVNPTRVYGPGILSKSNSVTIMVEKYIRGKWRIIPGDGKKIGNYVYIDDVVEGHIKAMEVGKSGQRFLLAGENATYNEFFETIRIAGNKKYKLFHLPLSMMKFLTRIIFVISRLLNKTPPLTIKWVNKYYHDWETDNSKATNKLGINFTSLKAGIEKTVLWLNK